MHIYIYINIYVLLIVKVKDLIKLCQSFGKLKITNSGGNNQGMNERSYFTATL